MQTNKKILLLAGMVFAMANPLLSLGDERKNLTLDVKAKDVRFEKPQMMRWSQQKGKLLTPMELFLENKGKKSNDYDDEENEERKKWQERLYTVSVPSETVENLIFGSPQPEYFVIKRSYRIGEDMSLREQEEKSRLTKMLKRNEAMVIAIDKVRNNLGKNITEPAQKTIINAILDTLSDEKAKKDILKDLAKDRISKKLSNPIKGIYDGYYFDYMFAKNNLDFLNTKDKEEREGMLRALSKYPTFADAKRSYDKGNKDVFKGNLISVEQDREAIAAASGKSQWAQFAAALSYKMVINCTLKPIVFTGNKGEGYKLVELTDTFPNPFISEELTASKNNSDAYSYAKYSRTGKKWNWIESEKSKLITEEYPRTFKYLKYDSHPEYKVVKNDNSNMKAGYGVFDSKGNLVSYNIFNTYEFKFKHDYVQRSTPIGVELAKIAYKNNEHGIQKASAAAKSYITLQLGLRKKTAAEEQVQDRAAKKIANAMLGHATADAKYGRNTKASRQAKDKAGLSFFGALLAADTRDSDGVKWLLQIENDWTSRMGDYSAAYQEYIINNVPNVIERIDDVTYSVVYYDNQNKPAIKVVTTFKNDGAFKVKQVDQVTVY